MTERTPVQKQSSVVVQTLPLLSEHPNLAIKGGVAINYFHRDLPRYSVDIDLAYLPLEDRDTTLTSISEAISALRIKLQSAPINYPVTELTPKGQPSPTTLRIEAENSSIVLETNYILRGSVYPPAKQRLTPSARTEFKADFTAQTLSMEDTYGGKLSAALSRQLPRDFFDLKVLLENEGLTPRIMNAFVVYLSSATRPFYELLSPNPVDLSAAYNDNMLALRRAPVELEALLETRRKLIPAVQNALTGNQKEFLISMANGAPKWELLDVPHAKDLPGMKWKLMNLDKMDKQKRKHQAKQLEKLLRR